MFMKECFYLQTDFLKNMIKGFLVAVLTSAVLIVLFGYVCYKSRDPEGLFGTLGLTALYISSFAGGLASALFNKKNGWMIGGATGLLLAVVILLISFFVRPAGETVGLLGWIVYLLVAVVSWIGGVFGGLKKHKKHKRKKKK